GARTAPRTPRPPSTRAAWSPARRRPPQRPTRASGSSTRLARAGKTQGHQWLLSPSQLITVGATSDIFPNEGDTLPRDHDLFFAGLGAPAPDQLGCARN